MTEVCVCCGKKTSLFNGSHLNNKLCDNCYFPIGGYLTAMEDESDINKIKENYEFLIKKINESSYFDNGKQYIIKYANAVLKRQYNKILASITEKQKRDKFKVTTSNNFEGYSIKDYKGIVSGDAIYGTGLSSELDLTKINIAGDESYIMSDKINHAKNIAVERMIDNAMQMDCNAVVGIKFNYFTFSSNTIAVIVDGTAVNIIKHNIISNSEPVLNDSH